MTWLRWVASNVAYILGVDGPYGAVDPTAVEIEFTPHWAEHPCGGTYYLGPDDIVVRPL